MFAPEHANQAELGAGLSVEACHLYVSAVVMFKAQGSGDLFRIAVTGLKDGLELNLAESPGSLDTDCSGDFDTRMMRVLFATGYQLARGGYQWFKAPPRLSGKAKAADGAVSARQRVGRQYRAGHARCPVKS